MLPPKGGDPMTTERDLNNIDLEGTLASATEFTGMLPAIATYDDPDGLAAAVDVPAPVTAAGEDPAHSPLLGGSVRPYGARNPQTTTQATRPAKAPGPYRPDSARNR